MRPIGVGLEADSLTEGVRAPQLNGPLQVLNGSLYPTEPSTQRTCSLKASRKGESVDVPTKAVISSVTSSRKLVSDPTDSLIADPSEFSIGSERVNWMSREPVVCKSRRRIVPIEALSPLDDPLGFPLCVPLPLEPPPPPPPLAARRRRDAMETRMSVTWSGSL